MILFPCLEEAAPECDMRNPDVRSLQVDGYLIQPTDDGEQSDLSCLNRHGITGSQRNLHEWSALW